MEAVDRVVSLNGPRNRGMSNCWKCTDDTGCPPRHHRGRGPSVLNAFRIDAKRASEWLDGAIGQRRPRRTKSRRIEARCYYHATSVPGPNSPRLCVQPRRHARSKVRGDWASTGHVGQRDFRWANGIGQPEYETRLVRTGAGLRRAVGIWRHAMSLPIDRLHLQTRRRLRDHGGPLIRGLACSVGQASPFSPCRLSINRCARPLRTIVRAPI